MSNKSIPQNDPASQTPKLTSWQWQVLRLLSDNVVYVAGGRLHYRHRSGFNLYVEIDDGQEFQDLGNLHLVKRSDDSKIFLTPAGAAALASQDAPSDEMQRPGETHAQWLERMGLPPEIDLSDEALANLPILNLDDAPSDAPITAEPVTGFMRPCEACSGTGDIYYGGIFRPCSDCDGTGIYTEPGAAPKTQGGER